MTTSTAPLTQQPTSSSPPPSAGLHRDGEQARLVSLVRRRQLEQQRRDYENLSTAEWIQESLWEFWATVVGGDVGANATFNSENGVRFDRHEHYSDIVVPRHSERRRTRQPQSGGDDVHHSSNQCSARLDLDSSKRYKSLPLQVIIYICRQILGALRSTVRLVFDKFFLVSSSESPIILSSIQPSYCIQFTSDDVLKSTCLLWIGIKLGHWSERVTVSTIFIVVLFGFVFRRRVARSYESVGVPSLNGGTDRIEHQQLIQQSLSTTQKTRSNKQRATTTAATAKTTIAFSQTATEVRDANEKPQHIQAIHRLKTRFPNATHAECKRFYVCVKRKENEAAERIESWLKWREDCGLKLTVDANDTLQLNENDNREYNSTFVDEDLQIWNKAAKLAIELDTKGSSVDTTTVKLPQILCAYEAAICTDSTTHLTVITNRPPRTKDSSRILHIFPARVDLTLASASTYSLACALYLNHRLCRTTTEKITLLCDVRGGRGWANPTPWSMLPFIQSTSALLGKHYPERLAKFILFPMPSAAAWIWAAAQKCLDPNTASKVVVVGEEKGKKGMPEKMKEFFNEESLKLVEERRMGFMAPPRNVSEECVRAMLSC